MAKLDRDGKKKKSLKNLMKRGGIWYFKKMVGGKVESVSLNTSDLELARSRRDNLQLKMLQEKWDDIDNVKTKRNVATVGEVIERYENAKNLQLDHDTVRNNAWSLRHMLKNAKRLESVDNLSLTVLDAALVRDWQSHCLKDAGNDKLKQNRAAVTANSILRQARSVFGRRPMKHAIYDELVLPNLDSFRNAPMLEELKVNDYKKPEDELLKKIWKEAYKLRDGFASTEKEPKVEKHLELWLLFWIVSQTGLRKGEVKAMRYRWFQGETVRTCFETDFVPKGKKEREVPVSPSVEVECRRVAKENGWSTNPGDYVFQGTMKDKEDLFKEFGPWMRSHGWDRRQVSHELRKIYASDLLEDNEPYDVQMALGHQELKTTARYAARRKVQAVDQSARYGNIIPLPVQEKADQNPTRTGTEG